MLLALGSRRSSAVKIGSEYLLLPGHAICSEFVHFRSSCDVTEGGALTLPELVIGGVLLAISIVFLFDFLHL